MMTDLNFSLNYNKWHKNMSYAKSVIRIGFCLLVITNIIGIYGLSFGLLAAEIIGNLEEWI